MGDLSTQDVGARFAELICADDEWLRAEFDALVLAGFGAPPAWPRLPAPPWARPPAGPSAFGARPGQVAAPGPESTGRAPRWWRRQRSPPAE